MNFGKWKIVCVFTKYGLHVVWVITESTALDPRRVRLREASNDYDRQSAADPYTRLTRTQLPSLPKPDLIQI